MSLKESKIYSCALRRWKCLCIYSKSFNSRFVREQAAGCTDFLNFKNRLSLGFYWPKATGDGVGPGRRQGEGRLAYRPSNLPRHGQTHAKIRSNDFKSTQARLQDYKSTLKGFSILYYHFKRQSMFACGNDVVRTILIPLSSCWNSWCWYQTTSKKKKCLNTFI